MTLVLEESEDISPEILTPLLATMKKDNKEVLPVAVKLAEKVFENCAAKLKPYLSLAIQSLDVSLADYSDIVASVYEEGSSATRPSDGNAPTEQSDLEDKLARTSNNEDQDAQTQACESKPTASTVDETAQVANDKEACPEDVDANADRSPKMVTSNGVDEVGTKKLGASEEEENGANLHGQPSTDKGTSKPEVDDSEAGDKIESKLDHPDGKRGNKSDASTNMSESSDTSHVEGEKGVEELPDLQDSHDKGVHGSPRQDINSGSAKPSEKEAEISSPRASETEAGNVASPTVSENLQDDQLPKKAGRSKKKESSVQEETPLADLLSKKAIEGINDSEAKPHKRTRKNAPPDATDEDKMSTDVDTSKISSGGASDSETKKIKEMNKKIDESNNADEAPSMKKKKDSKRRSRGKAALENEVPKSSKDDQKEVSSPRSTKRPAKDEESHDETKTTSAKRKRGTGKDKASETLEYGDNLVGSKVKVWWPRDRQYYEGTVDSFDPIKKKHKVLYVDGDEETLNLKKERWVFVEDSLSSDEQTAEHASPDSASGMQKRKKAKTVSESSAKYGRTEVSPKSGAASTSKSKGTGPKSGRKSKDDGKIDLKMKEKTSKTGGKHEDDSSGKPNKVNSSKVGGRLIDDSPKPSTKSKDLDSKTKSKQESPKMTSKSKQEAQKTSTKSKGKSSQGGDNSSNGLGKAKHGSSKKEAGVLRDKSIDSAKTQESGKGRSSELKSQENETVSTKKRRRG